MRGLGRHGAPGLDCTPIATASASTLRPARAKPSPRLLARRVRVARGDSNRWFVRPVGPRAQSIRRLVSAGGPSACCVALAQRGSPSLEGDRTKPRGTGLHSGTPTLLATRHAATPATLHQRGRRISPTRRGLRRPTYRSGRRRRGTRQVPLERLTRDRLELLDFWRQGVDELGFEARVEGRAPLRAEDAACCAGRPQAVVGDSPDAKAK